MKGPILNCSKMLFGSGTRQTCREQCPAKVIIMLPFHHAFVYLFLINMSHVA